VHPKTMSPATRDDASRNGADGDMPVGAGMWTSKSSVVVAKPLHAPVALRGGNDEPYHPTRRDGDLAAGGAHRGAPQTLHMAHELQDVTRRVEFGIQMITRLVGLMPQW
jgi:hypothetical protein